MGYVFIALGVIGTTASQMFIKAASRGLERVTFGTLLRNPWLYAGFLTLLIVPVFVNLALDYFDLAVVFAVSGLFYITVPLGARLFFKEQLSPRMLIGMLCIVFGVVLYYI